MSWKKEGQNRRDKERQQDKNFCPFEDKEGCPAT